MEQKKHTYKIKIIDGTEYTIDENQKDQILFRCKIEGTSFVYDQNKNLINPEAGTDNGKL